VCEREKECVCVCESLCERQGVRVFVSERVCVRVYV